MTKDELKHQIESSKSQLEGARIDELKAELAYNEAKNWRIQVEISILTGERALRRAE